MAKLDVSTIEGFDGMSAEAKVEALMALEVLDAVDMSQYVAKATADKYASEAADLKKQLRSYQTDGESARNASDEAIKALQEKYDLLVKESTIKDYTAKYAAMPGFDERLARETAEALYNSDTETVFANQQKANQAYEKQMKADALKGMKPPAGGDKSDDESENIKLAKEIGRRNAESRKASDDILSNYFVGRR